MLGMAVSRSACLDRRGRLCIVARQVGLGLQALRPVRFVDQRVDHSGLEIEPDAGVFATVIAAAGDGPLRINATSVGVTVQVRTIMVSTAGNHVWPAKLPLNYTLAYVLTRQRQWQLAA